MCRFAAYSGPPRPIADLAINAPKALQKQSLAASEGKTRTNGDGFGLGWYDPRGDAFHFRDTNPAWADQNFETVAQSIISPLYFVHCRAATGTETARSNCHPFKHEQFLFMHNGQVGGYGCIRRSIESMIADQFYSYRRGTSDSEAIFLAMLSRMKHLGIVSALSAVIHDILDLQVAQGISAPVRFSAVISDGEQLWVFRWASDGRPPSLYVRSGNDGIVVASEPVDCDEGGWVAVRPNSLLEIANGRILRTSDFDPARYQAVEGENAITH